MALFKEVGTLMNLTFCVQPRQRSGRFRLTLNPHGGMMTTGLSSKPTLSFSNALMAGALGGVVAALVNVIIYYVVQSLNGGPLIVEGAPLPLVLVLLSSLVPGLAAGMVYWAFARFTRTPTRWFLILAGVVLVLSAFGPLTQATGLALLALELMHLGAALPITWAVLRLRD